MSQVIPRKPVAAPALSDNATDPNLATQAWSDAVIVNEQAAHHNANLSPSFPMTQAPGFAVFKTSTIAPSPEMPQINDLAPLSVDTNSNRLGDSPLRSSPLSAGLRIQTDIKRSNSKGRPNDNIRKRPSSEYKRSDSSKSMNVPLGRTPSIKNVLTSSYGSAGSNPNSAFSSPMLNAMADVTPLPSPLMSGDSPGPWKQLGSRPTSREYRPPTINADTALVTANGELISTAIAHQNKRRAFQGLGLAAIPAEPSPLLDPQVEKDKNLEVLHVRNRSLSEYIPDPLTVPKPGHITVSGSHIPILDPSPESSMSPDTHLHREPHLAVQRGLAPLAAAKPPTPPSSRTGGESSDSESSLSVPAVIRVAKKPRYQYFDAHTKHDSKRRRWRSLKTLGQGTFSTVVLATSQLPPKKDQNEESDVFGQQMEGLPTPNISTAPEQNHNAKSLVAVKICEHGPKGGASEKRVEMSLKRELEIMKSIHHPSLVHLKAWSVEPSRAILVLSYCPGGDLFEVASEHQEVLTVGFLRRIFAELIAAVRYLHSCHIVHRDIKLENVLVNLPLPEITSKPSTYNWLTHPSSLITLTDLGLSRRVADDEKLTTRCGSDDYAAPEVIMGQPYDGRATDAWSLGVFLYALLESRLPFDPLPEVMAPKQRSRTSHRIARVEWRWVRFAGDDGEHEGDEKLFEEKDLLGAMKITEGLLQRARSRWTLDRVMEEEWVKGGLVVDGVEGDKNLRFREEDEADEVVEDGDV